MLEEYAESKNPGWIPKMCGADEMTGMKVQWLQRFRHIQVAAICPAFAEGLHRQEKEQWEMNLGSPSEARSQKVILVLSVLDGSEPKIWSW